VAHTYGGDMDDVHIYENPTEKEIKKLLFAEKKKIKKEKSTNLFIKGNGHEMTGSYVAGKANIIAFGWSCKKLSRNEFLSLLLSNNI